MKPDVIKYFNFFFFFFCNFKKGKEKLKPLVVSSKCRYEIVMTKVKDRIFVVCSLIPGMSVVVH